MSKFYIGTSGWSYKDWIPVFYPKGQTGGFDWLRYYAHYFNCVEVNSTYYAYMDPHTVNGWIEKTSDTEDFTFTIKLHQDFTHKRDYDIPKIQAVQYNLNLLQKAERLGGLLIQFPYSFGYNQDTMQHIIKLTEIFEAYSCFIEVRHNSWNKEDIIKQFREMKLNLCTIDQPVIGKSIHFEPVITGDKAYIRLHGRNKEEWFKNIQSFGRKQTPEQQSARYNYLYSAGELAELQQKLLPLKDIYPEIYVLLNNHPNGNAVANAFELIHLLEEKSKVNMPESILKVEPRLERIYAGNLSS